MEENNKVANTNGKNKILLVLVVILLVGILLFGAYVLGTKNNSNSNNDNNIKENDTSNEQKEENVIKEISINDSLITSLVYPKDDVIGIGHKSAKNWYYKNITIDTFGRTNMMQNAAYDLESKHVYDENGTAVNIYSAKEIENNFRKIYGPDTNYYNGDFSEGDISCLISKYNIEDDTYLAYSGCGGASVSYIEQIAKTYKAEQEQDNIYVYEYVQSVSVAPVDINNSDSKAIVKLLDQNNKEKGITIDYDNYANTVYQMMNNGEVSTYKWTFKKQSDGKYYFYSGAWEN